MKISIVGTGYVGLVTGVGLAEKGHSVVCVDIDPVRVDAILHGVSPIHERGLSELLARNVGDRLGATTDLAEAVDATDISFITVGTPFDGQRIDLTWVTGAARGIGKALAAKVDHHVVVIKSTVVPGTTDEVVIPILEEVSGKRAGVDFGVGTNPEFLTEGEAVNDFLKPDRIVLGAGDDRTAAALRTLYAVFPGVPLVETTRRTAEMIKYASNSLLATMISFSNEMANVAAAVGGVDVADVLRALHLSSYLSVAGPDGRRIEPGITKFVWAGCGFGGSCLPKDVKALAARAAEAGCQTPVLDAVMRVNEQRPGEVLRLLKKHFSSLRDVCVAILGLAFRPDTADMRESPALPIIAALRGEGARILAYDPVAGPEARRRFADGAVDVRDDLGQTLADAQAVILVTAWREFEAVPDLLRLVNPPPVVVDGRRLLDRHRVARYEGIGL